MIKLTAKINLLNASSGSLEGVYTTAPKNNISSEIASVFNKKVNASNPFILGASKLGDGSTYSGEVNYFIGGIIADDEGSFIIKQSPYYYVISIDYSGQTPAGLSIAFDTLNNRYPPEIEVNAQIGTHFDNDPIYVIDELKEGRNTIYIKKWNAPNYPIVITGIYLTKSIDLDYKSLTSLNCSLMYRSDNKLPSYGIISNTGEIEFIDLDGEIKDYADRSILTSDLDVLVHIENNVVSQVGSYKTKSWGYDNYNRSVTVSLKDDLEEWQDIQVKGFNYNPINPFEVLTTGSMEDLYKWLYNKTPNKYKMLDFAKLDTKTKNILTNTKINYPLLKDGTLWEQWTKLCEVCGLYIYKNKQGQTVCTYTYGS